MKVISVLLLLPLAGCGLFPPAYTPGEKHCIADAEVRADLKVADCGKSVDGICSTDSIIDQEEVEVEKCLSEN